MKHAKKHGFTLVELLVVIGIIAVLIAILMPALRNAKEMAIKTECSSRLRQLSQACIAYAGQNEGRLPPGARDFTPNQEHCIWIGSPTYDAISKYLGTGQTTAAFLAAQGAGNPAEMEAQTNYLIACPTIATGEAARLPFKGALGWVIGYNYLGDHVEMAKESTDAGMPWQSPNKLSSSGSLPLFCDLNDWAAVEAPGGWVAVSHRKGASGGFYYPAGGAQPPEVYGATGGNVAFLDGSVVWRNISEMQKRGHCHPGANAYPGKW